VDIHIEKKATMQSCDHRFSFIPTRVGEMAFVKVMGLDFLKDKKIRTHHNLFYTSLKYE